MVFQIPPKLTWWDPVSLLVLKALDGAWSCGTAWWPHCLQNWSIAYSEAVVKINPSSSTSQHTSGMWPVPCCPIWR